jgi:Tfp pilus assembly protein PilO
MQAHQRSQLFSVLLVPVLLVLVVLIVMPFAERVSGLNNSVDLLSDELQGLQSEYESLTSLSEDVARSEATKNALLAAVPEGPEQDELIRELSSLASDNGFELNAMNFSLSVDNDYGEHVRLTGNLTGNYSDLIGFLEDVENGERLMQVSSLTVQRTTTESVVFNLTIEAYYQ